MASEEDPLKESLATAFSQPISLPSSAAPSLPPPPPPPEDAFPPLGASISESAVNVGESWREEYDARVSEWRAQSAVARKKAEETREHYASVRESEGEQEGGREPLPGGGGFGAPGTERVSVVDARDLVTGEAQGHPQQPHQKESDSVSHPSDLEHERWEDVPSVVSSFPSLPSNTSPPAVQPTPAKQLAKPSPSSKKKQKADAENKPSAADIAKPTPPAVTPLVLDVTLPNKTRAFALISSIAINMFLPFVNGVMLGFGEIFARNVLAPWIGWKSVINPNGTRTLQPQSRKPASPTDLRRDEIRNRKPNF